MRVLAIESSCDETAAAVVDGNMNVLSNVVHTQIDVHSPYGGVVPEIASREHLVHLGPVVARALRDAHVSISGIDVVAATYGPGLVGALLVGLQAAKGIAVARGIPFVAVHHIEGHLMAAMVDAAAPRPPFMGLVVSGGHTALYACNGVGASKLVGQTRDDAAGECFDKTAKLLGLGYPGGVVIDRLAQQGNPQAFAHALKDRTHFDYSFSGLKTAIRLVVEEQRRLGRILEGALLADICASVQRAIVDALLHKALLACRQKQLPTLVLGGGVAANSALRTLAVERGAALDVTVYAPPKHLCTDNAVMIAAAAHMWLRENKQSRLRTGPAPDATVESSTSVML
jgi:N6-L-threonylcarbamoyladenine synthase